MNYPWLIEQKGESFVIDKPYGLPSFWIVELYKHLLNKKVGHGGTLDPLATGKLLILTGRDTKLAEKYLNHEKTYEFTLLLGAHTSSGDLEQIIEEDNAFAIPSEEAIKTAVNHFEGEYEQIVPQYSAVKQQGKALYRDAVKMDIPEEVLPTRLVKIPSIEVNKRETLSHQELKQKLEGLLKLLNESFAGAQKLNEELTGRQSGKYGNVHRGIEQALIQNIETLKQKEYCLVSVTATVSKGTYIRSLADDIAKRLGTRGLVFELRRTGV